MAAKAMPNPTTSVLRADTALTANSTRSVLAHRWPGRLSASPRRGDRLGEKHEGGKAHAKLAITMCHPQGLGLLLAVGDEVGDGGEHQTPILTPAPAGA